MIRIIFTLIILILPNQVWAFQCPEKSQAQRYEEAERVFLVYITQTKLNDDLYKNLMKDYMEEDEISSESVKGIFADYNIIEEFKGDPQYKPILVDLLGIGTGYVGLVPGKYYFIMLEPPYAGKSKEIRFTDLCNTPL